MNKYKVTNDSDPSPRNVLGMDIDPWADADDIEAFDEDEAAEKYLDKHFADLSYPQGSVWLWVRDEEGTQCHVEVEISYEPIFSANTATCDHPKPCRHWDFQVVDGVCTVCGVRP